MIIMEYIGTSKVKFVAAYVIRSLSLCVFMVHCSESDLVIP